MDVIHDFSVEEEEEVEVEVEVEVATAVDRTIP
jgi:hypothetical protein